MILQVPELFVNEVEIPHSDQIVLDKFCFESVLQQGVGLE